MLFYLSAIDFVICNVFIENFEDKLDKNINYIKGIMRDQQTLIILIIIEYYDKYCFRIFIFYPY